MAFEKIGNVFSKWSLAEIRRRGGDVILGFSFIVMLAYFLHLKEVSVDQLHLKAISDRYILAQTEFEFPDTEATRLLKEEAIRDLGKIYYLQDRDVGRIEKKIHDYLVDRPYWRHELPTTTYEELINASDMLRDALFQIKLTDPRTLTKLRQLGQCSKYCLAYGMENGEILSESIWKEIEKTAFPVSTPATRFIVQQYQGQAWSVQEDLEKQHFLSRMIKDSIPLKRTKVLAGSRIINAGDKVTLRHIDMLKGMKKKLIEEQCVITPKSLLGGLGLALILTLTGWFYLRTLYPYALKSMAKKGLIAAVAILTLFFSKFVEYMVINNTGYLADVCRFPVFVPLTTLLLAILIDRKVAMVVSLFVSLVLATTLILHYNNFLIVNILTAVMATILIKTVRKRKEVFEICAKLWLLTIPLILGINLMENAYWDVHILFDLLTSLVSMTLIAVIVVTILPLLETTFKITTDMTLLESADLSHPLLRRLNLEAPGTYRHSLSVAALAEEAALAINANPIFCRVAALYHDIGKLSQPQYFTENQFNCFNMHHLLSPEESAQVIISHVSEGVKLAEQYELPPTIIDVIREHHGTGIVYYFYHAQLEQCRTTSVTIQESLFRYSGPTPQSRESAIIMISDSVEAAYRSLDEFSEKAVVELVQSIVNDKIREHQLDSSRLTFDEVEGIKKSMIQALITSAHTRIKYPEKVYISPWRPQEV